MDVTPITLGIKTIGGMMMPLIPRGTTIPTSRSITISAVSHSQPCIEVHVLQGERPMAGDNRTLVRIMLDGLLPGPHGMPQIELSFDIDINGILSMKAHDKATGREQNMTITASSGLSKDEVERMRREADTHAAEDSKRRDEVEARNTADTMAYTAERTLREQGDKIPADIKVEVEGKIAAVRSALSGQDAEQMKRAAGELSQAMQKMGQAVYQQAGAGAGAGPGAGPGPGGAPPPPGGGGPGKGDAGTVEGEFREV